MKQSKKLTEATNRIAVLTNLLSDERINSEMLVVQIEQAGMIVETLSTEIAELKREIVRLKAEVMLETDKVRRQKITVDDLMSRLGYEKPTQTIEARCPFCQRTAYKKNGEVVHVIDGTPLCVNPNDALDF